MSTPLSKVTFAQVRCMARGSCVPRSTNTVPLRANVSTRHTLAGKAAELSALRMQLDALSPGRVLRRGYALVRAQNAALRGVMEARVGGQVKIAMHDGTMLATVDAIRGAEHEKNDV